MSVEMSDAADRLLSAPELIELILLELDHRDLLCRANRVSQQFHDVIATSPKIQAKLFFKPINVKPGTDSAIESIQNSQMWKRSWRLQDLFQTQEQKAEEEQPQGQIQFKSPFAEPAPPAAPKKQAASTAPYAFIGPWKSYHTHPSFTCRGVSWRRMLIQQPAITCIGQVIVRRRLDGSISTKVGKAHCPGGVRMGHFWDTLRESMVLLKTDMCLMRLVWWEPTLTAFEKALYPMAGDVLRLFDEGAQIVLAVGFSECAPTDRFYGKLAHEYDVLCACEDNDPLPFKMDEIITPARTSRRRSHAV